MNGNAMRLMELAEAGHVTTTDLQIAQYVAGAIVPEPSFFDLLSVARAVGATQLGHVCADLRRSGSVVPVSDPDVPTTEYTSPASTVEPTFTEWESYISSSALVHVGGSWEEHGSVDKPLMYFDGRLYLSRQWEDERRVAIALKHRLGESQRTVAGAEAMVRRLFPDAEANDRQMQAVRTSLGSGTSVLMGGPGTGKTYTIARILLAMLGCHEGDRPLRIALAAPTAKAAAQMRESLLQAIGGDHSFPSEHVELLRDLEPTTIHRLLGRRTRTQTRFAHDAAKPLDVDVVIVDEMSMVSLALMARLLEAMRPETRLVLVGDPDQLASVENGSILPDLSHVQDRFGHAITRLEVSHRNRLTASSAFTEAVRTEDVGTVTAMLSHGQASGESSFEFIPFEGGLQRANKELIARVVGLFQTAKVAASAGDVESALDGVAAARVVCAHRQGDHGVEGWNQVINDKVFDKSPGWESGKFVIKTRNDPANGLANGDSGIVVRPEPDGPLSFAFRRGSDVLTKPTSAVDDIELAFATTVHKAQGSEFGTVVVVVPPKSSPLCTRELLYTAVTRAKPKVILVGATEDVLHAVNTTFERFSGLVDRLSATP